MLEYKVQVDKQSHLKHDKGNKQFLDGPMFDQWVVEFNHFLDAFPGEYIVLIGICELPEEFVTEWVVIVIESG